MAHEMTGGADVRNGLKAVATALGGKQTFCSVMVT
jgi:hypothetical protein